MVVLKNEVSVLYSLFALMPDTDTDEDNSMTLYDIKENLKDYSLSKLKSLASVMIYSLDDLDKVKEDLR